MASPVSRRPPSKPTPGGSAVIIISVWPKHKETHWLMYLSSLGMAGSRYVHPGGQVGSRGSPRELGPEIGRVPMVGGGRFSPKEGRIEVGQTKTADVRYNPHLPFAKLIFAPRRLLQ